MKTWAAWLVTILSACGGGATATQARGTLDGAAWSSDDATAWRVGPHVIVSVGAPSVSKLPSGRFVSIQLDGARCAGEGGRIDLPDPAARVSWSDELTGATGEATGGHVDVLECGGDRLRLRFDARFVEGEASGTVAATIPAAGVTGRLAGAAWTSVAAHGTFCEYCGGGPMIYAVADGVGLSVGVQLDGGRCGAGVWTETLGGDGNDARVWYGPPQGPIVDAVDGTVVVERCARDHAALRVRARFADGSEVAGRLVAPLEVSGGAE